MNILLWCFAVHEGCMAGLTHLRARIMQTSEMAGLQGREGGRQVGWIKCVFDVVLDSIRSGLPYTLQRGGDRSATV